MGEHVSRASVAAVRAHVCHAHAVGVDYLFTLLVNIHACVCLLLSCDCARHAWMRGKQQAATLVSIINQSTTLVFIINQSATLVSIINQSVIIAAGESLQKAANSRLSKVKTGDQPGFFSCLQPKASSAR